MEEAGAHVLVFPYPAQGHMPPLLDLTHQLAIRRLTITILVTPKNQPLLQPLLFSHTSIKALVLPFPHHPHIPHGVENCKDMAALGTNNNNSSRNMSMDFMCALGGLYDSIVDWFESHPSPPVAIISDMFLGWTHRLACKLGIRRYVFSPSGALAYSVIQSLWRDRPRRKNSNDADDQIISFPKIPNSPRYPWWQISAIYRKYIENEGHEDSEFVRDGFLCNLESYGLIINSFDELEGIYVDHLKEEMGHERVSPIGPLLPPEYEVPSPNHRNGSNVILANRIGNWLNNSDEGSVLYVCFGSQHTFTKKQMEVLALGLERSGVRFIWVVRVAKGGHVEGKDWATLPDGYEERVAGKGLIVKEWAPQIVILSHPAIGGFLTHCGWNSILESLVAGVPMLAWPMTADQFADATLLVDDLQVAIRVGEGEKIVSYPDEFASLVARLMSPGQGERSRALELSRAARSAVKNRGSSCRSLDELVTQLPREAFN